MSQYFYTITFTILILSQLIIYTTQLYTIYVSSYPNLEESQKGKTGVNLFIYFGSSLITTALLILLFYSFYTASEQFTCSNLNKLFITGLFVVGTILVGTEPIVLYPYLKAMAFYVPIEPKTELPFNRYRELYTKYKQAGGHLLPPTDVRWEKYGGSIEDISAVLEDIREYVPSLESYSDNPNCPEALYQDLLLKSGYKLKAIEFTVHQNYSESYFDIRYFVGDFASENNVRDVLLLQGYLPIGLDDKLIPIVVKAISIIENQEIIVKVETKNSGMVTYI